MEETILRTLKNNYGVAIQVLSPEIDSLGIQSQRTILPTLSMGYNKRNTWPLPIPGSMPLRSKTEYYSYDAQVTQLLPIGGTIAFSMVNYRNYHQQIPDG